jgi:hypothetical protein
MQTDRKETSRQTCRIQISQAGRQKRDKQADMQHTDKTGR